MIVKYNVCDNCGNQAEIQPKEIESGVEVLFKVRPVYEAVKDRFRHFSEEDSLTFCDLNCFTDYIKSSFQKFGEKKEKDPYDD